MIKVVNLHKKYKLGKNNFIEALRGATLGIKEGEMVAIMGPSGSGKSTLMHLIGCLDHCDSGEIHLGGIVVNKLNRKELTKIRSKEIGFIFQGFNLIPTLSALENVALASEYAGNPRKKAHELARISLMKVGLEDRIHHLPSELSGGQQQRVAIARALINKPKVVLGDEPTGDLDTKTSEGIVKMMRKINKDTSTTFVLVTHNPEVAKACDRIIYMKDGRVV
jgi:putative ABC transport system ATP-binding protein